MTREYILERIEFLEKDIEFKNKILNYLSNPVRQLYENWIKKHEVELKFLKEKLKNDFYD